jgi:hypothetical protein
MPRSRRFRSIPEDTAPAAHAVQTAIYKKMGGRQRTAVAFRLNALARETAMAGIRARHPGYDEEQVRFALHRLILGDEVTRAAWPGRGLVDP